ncbi:hypothetical protein NEISICOT_00747 [Neisseria sicca ATCC 29256]|uniref:Uncharacterized protein n=1 Tax=Neisseria sicca ATCC 29256 TaxID=547045 RepID=C6M2K7_NEISI|nr:hypothetical protein NEISICOT_00747 [Neisseria sicca ATCC 29256]
MSCFPFLCSVAVSVCGRFCVVIGCGGSASKPIGWSLLRLKVV